MSDPISRRDWLKTSALAGFFMAFSGCGFLPRTEAQNGLDGNKPVRLFANENPYGFSPKAKQAIIDSVEMGNQYADFETVAEFERMIADREGLKPENVVLGSGSGEVLCMTGAAYGLEKGELLCADPTFPMIHRYAENFGAKINKVPLDKNHVHDLGEMEKRISEATSLVYVCNPNNPTATILPHQTLKDFCERVSRQKTVFVDEAYLEYTEDFPKNSMTELIRRDKDVIVSRTFSKIYGMAGMRIGYGLARADTARRLKKFRMTWFNSLGINAAVAAYGDTDFIKESRLNNEKVRDFLCREMDKMNLPYAKSHGNFIWADVGQQNRRMGEKMRKHNILVRNARPPLDGWARITVGTLDQMKAFVRAFRQVMVI